MTKAGASQTLQERHLFDAIYLPQIPLVAFRLPHDAVRFYMSLMKRGKLRITAVEGKKSSLSSGKGVIGYWDQLSRACEEAGIDFRVVKGLPRLLLSKALRKSDLYILAFNESKVWENPEDRAAIRALEKALSGEHVVHHLDTALLIGHKSDLNRHLAAAGVPVPRQFQPGDPDISYPVFAIPDTDCGQPVEIIESGELPADRCCTRMIDTRIKLLGREYFAYIRVMVTGNEILAVTPRVRPAEDDNRSVHGKDMPLDPELMNEAYRRIAIPNMEQIRDICARLADALPFGSYSHDLVPEFASGRIYVCETGWKFHDRPMSLYTKDIKDQLEGFSFHDFDMVRKQVREYERYITQFSDTGSKTPAGRPTNSSFEKARPTG